jgi:hypothetical protein
MLDCLKEKFTTIETWAESKKGISSNMFIEDSMKSDLFNNSQCSSVFKNSLNLMKVIELGIVNYEFEDIKDVKF